MSERPPPPPRPPPPGGESADARHRREESERRAKRKSSKSSRAGSEKSRKRTEHIQRVLEQQSKHKKGKVDGPDKAELNESAFQALFQQRAQGFRIDFAFRNATPRPPVGPCFVGQGLDGLLHEYTQYRPENAVESNYTYKLHSEHDLGVPLAPSAMNLQLYEPKDASQCPTLHPSDEALLDWKGSLGDTAADELQRSKDRARAAARLALAGKSGITVPKSNAEFTKKQSHKPFSRVLDEKNLVFFMKKTSYLSNNFSRKVHDFTSLAETKAKVAADLQAKDKKLDRSAKAIERSFAAFDGKTLKHPTNKKAKPLAELPLLPNAQHWGHSYTHVIMDNPPKSNIATPPLMEHAMIAHVEQRSSTSKMTCQVMIPQEEDKHQTVSQYDLDVVPLKEEDDAHSSFLFLISPNQASYVPIPSRVQLMTGRPAKKNTPLTQFTKRPPNAQDLREIEERGAEVDLDLAKKVGVDENAATPAESSAAAAKTSSNTGFGFEDDDDDDDDDE